MKAFIVLNSLIIADFRTKVGPTEVWKGGCTTYVYIP